MPGDASARRGPFNYGAAHPRAPSHQATSGNVSRYRLELDDVKVLDAKAGVDNREWIEAGPGPDYLAQRLNAFEKFLDAMADKWRERDFVGIRARGRGRHRSRCALHFATVHLDRRGVLMHQEARASRRDQIMTTRPTGYLCAHCDAEECADHCPESPGGQHRPRTEGTVGIDHLNPETTNFDVQIECEACGAEGHSIVLVEVDDILDNVRWDCAR